MGSRRASEETADNRLWRLISLGATARGMFGRGMGRMGRIAETDAENMFKEIMDERGAKASSRTR
jgi:hypothetical protein